MRVPGARALQLSARWLRSRSVEGGLILGYHRIAPVGWDPFALSVSPEHFAEHLEALTAHARPTRLRDLIRALDEGRPVSGAVALTFDDGYAATLALAKPLLARHAVPATVFVTTGHLGSEFWWDALARMLAPDARAGTIRLTLDGEARTWAAAPAADLDGARRRLLSVYECLHGRPPDVIREAIGQLAAAVAGGPASPAHRALTADEIVDLARDDLIEIGAHGQTHSVLATLPALAQEDEVRTSKATLERLLGRPTSGFSYPHGSASAQTIAIVRRAGFAFACASDSDVASRRSDRFRLPRFWIPDCDGRVFARWLRRWLPT